MDETKRATPGRGAMIAMSQLRNDIAFKRPRTPSPLGKRRRKVSKILDEDTYVAELGKIIERDFFPDLERLKAKSEYLDAVERNDVMKLRELHMKYTACAQTASARLPSPATFDTPANIHNTDNDLEPNECDTNVSSEEKQLSLDEYLNTHTSEDDNSFAEMMAESERRHRAKYAYLYNEEAQSVDEHGKALALPSIAQQAQIPLKKLTVDTWIYRNRNHIMFVPDGEPLNAAERQKQRREIVHDNTRLQICPFNALQSKETIREVARQQNRALDGKIGVDGKELLVGGGGAPHVNGFPLVRSPSPYITAGTPLMTWGEVEGTPFRLDGSDTPLRTPGGPCFKMSAPAKREQLAMALAERAGERHRDKKKRAMDAARRQAASSSRDHRMSPAAQRLATSLTPRVKLGIKPRPEDDLTDNLLNINVSRRQSAAEFF